MRSGRKYFVLLGDQLFRSQELHKFRHLPGCIIESEGFIGMDKAYTWYSLAVPSVTTLEAAEIRPRNSEMSLRVPTPSAESSIG